jgi:N-acetyl-gamma-glutamyl-phosphate reductase
MEQELGCLAGDPLSLTFTPHLVPMTRGVLTTCYGQGTRPLDGKEVRGVLEAAYQEEPFVRLSPEGEYPTTGQVWGSNHADLAVQVDTRTNRVIVISVLDNLVKGAAGAAIQNMNLMAGLPETRGLEGLGIPV